MGGNTGNYSKTTIKKHPTPLHKKYPKNSLSSSKAKSYTLIVILKSHLAKKEKKYVKKGWKECRKN